MSDMTRREFTALIGDLAGARTRRSRRFAPRGEWTQYCVSSSPACRALRAEFHQRNICDKKGLPWQWRTP